MYRAVSSRLTLPKGNGRTLGASRGLFRWLTGESSNPLPPLDTPLRGVSLPPSLPDFVEPSNTKITTLPNGLKIASETSPNPAASIGLYLDCGSHYETPLSSGASLLLEKMSFKSTANRSHFRVVREVEAIGGNVGASASREQMGYTFDALKTYVPQMIELLIDCVRNPAFLDWEVNEELRKVKAELGELSNNPQGLLLEAVHSAGYSGALANPLLASETALNRLNSSLLEEFVAVAHVAIAFEVPGGWKKEKEAIALTILQMLMGGGGSFSAGGPGKGMHSRLFLRVLNEHQQIHSFSAFNSLFNNTGLFGIYASTMIASEDIGRQVLTYGERKPLEQFLNAVDGITLNDITKISQKIISSPLTMASYGDVTIN